MTIEQTIDAILRPSIEHMGFRLVRVKLMDVLGKRTLQIMAERVDGKAMLVDDCAEISHMSSALLDVDDPISGAYHLEVTSPGIDRPLVHEEDFVAYAGFEIKLETLFPLNGRKRYRGMLRGFNEGRVDMMQDGELQHIPYAKISHAKLVLTDELIKAYQDGKVTH